MKNLFIIKKSPLMFFAIIGSLMLCLGCTNESTVEEENLTFEMLMHKQSDKQLNFNASLKGRNEVPAVESKAAGEAIVKISKDETSIHYKLIVSHMDNITASHFHVAPAGTNGGVVAFLFSNPGPQPSGIHNGVLAEGTITAADVIGPLAGDLNALIAAMREGNIYVNVHSTEFPGGEIRGQLK